MGDRKYPTTLYVNHMGMSDAPYLTATDSAEEAADVTASTDGYEYEFGERVGVYELVRVVRLTKKTDVTETKIVDKKRKRHRASRGGK